MITRTLSQYTTIQDTTYDTQRYTIKGNPLHTEKTRHHAEKAEDFYHCQEGQRLAVSLEDLRGAQLAGEAPLVPQPGEGFDGLLVDVLRR